MTRWRANSSNSTPNQPNLLEHGPPSSEGGPFVVHRACPIALDRAIQSFSVENSAVTQEVSEDRPMTDSHQEHPQIIRCRTTADFLAALPQLAGFTATDSLFVVLFTGAQAERAVRFDLPISEEPSESTQLLDLVCDILREAGAAGDSDTAPALVVSSARSFAEAGGAPWRRLARRLERRFRREHIGIRELCCLAPDGWVSYLERDAPQCGHPLSEIDASPVALEARVHGEPVPDLSTLGEIPVATSARVRAVARALASIHPFPHATPETATSRTTRFDRHEVPAWFDDTAEVTREFRKDSGTPSPEMTARLVRCAAHPDRWLLLALGILTRPEFPSELARDMSAGPFTNVAIDLYVNQAEEPQPGWSIRRVLAAISPEFTEHHRLHGLRARLATAISETPREDRPALLALSGWVWWLGGNQTVAHRHVEAALDIMPEHEISMMVQRITAVPLYAGLLARWPRRAA